MLNNAAGLSKIVLVTGYTDLRRGIDGLAALIKTEYGRDPFEKDVLYLFAGRQAGKIKCLLWEGDGFLLLIKPLNTVKILHFHHNFFDLRWKNILSRA